MTACQHCRRRIVWRNGAWIDPLATGDDSVWRHTCDSNDAFTAEHAPEAAVREYCPVGELTGNRHTYIAGRGIVVPWDVAGDPRPNVETCHACRMAAQDVADYLSANGYQNLEEWAADSDYTYNGGTWRDEHGTTVNPFAQLLAAIERDLARYE